MLIVRIRRLRRTDADHWAFCKISIKIQSGLSSSLGTQTIRRSSLDFFYVAERYSFGLRSFIVSSPVNHPSNFFYCGIRLIEKHRTNRKAWPVSIHRHAVLLVNEHLASTTKHSLSAP